MRNRRSASPRSDRARNDAGAGWLAAPAAVMRDMGWGPRDAIALAAGAIGSVAILVNALFLQTGPHPAPLFKASLSPTVVEATNTVPVMVPRARPVEPVLVKAESPAPRTAAEIMGDIQRELARRGFYDGSIDGLHGPKTDAAIRDFEQAAGMKLNLQASEALLQAIMKSSAEAQKPAAPSAAVPSAAPPPTAAPAGGDASSRRVMTLQRALAQFGYGQIRPTGVLDADTRAAIEKFERERKLPVTGQPSDRVVKELAGLTGRQIE